MRVTAENKGKRRVERRYNRPEQTGNKRKETSGDLKGKTTERRDAEKRQWRPKKKRKRNEPKG